MSTCELLPPLLGHLIALTGHRRIDELAAHFENLGASVLRGPMLQTRPTVDTDGRLRGATHALVSRPPAYLVATTGIGIRTWFNAAASWGIRNELIAALRETRILARGPKVVGSLSEAGLEPWFVAPSGRTETLVDGLRREPLAHVSIAFQLPGSTMDHDVEQLRHMGAEVTELAVYEWTGPDDVSAARRLARAVAERRPSAITFTSRPAVNNFVALCHAEGLTDAVGHSLRGSVPAICVGDATADALRDAFDTPVLTPTLPLLGGIVEMTVDALRLDGHRHIDVPGSQVVVQRRLVAGNGEAVITSDREADVLHQLVGARRRVVLRDELLTSVWNGERVDPSVVDTTIARLRRRLAKTGLRVQTVNGRGYQLDGDLTTCPRHDEAAPALI